MGINHIYMLHISAKRFPSPTFNCANINNNNIKFKFIKNKITL